MFNTPLSNVDEFVEDYSIDFSRLLYMLYIDLEQQIARADTKAQLILSANAILIAAVTSLGTHLELESLRLAGLEEIISLFSTLLMFVAMIGSVYTALTVAFPRHIKPDKAQGDRLSLYYSAHIALFTVEDFIDSFYGMTLQDVKRSVLEGIHAKATIAQKKFINVQRSLICLFAAVVLWAISQSVLQF